MDILTRMYPCGECASHFRHVVAAAPPRVASRADFSRWMCEAHNTVSRRLGKPSFNCALVEARWAGVECGEEGEGGGSACSLEVGRRR
jgi:FAD-linked sulfhydryl oxidase